MKKILLFCILFSCIGQPVFGMNYLRHFFGKKPEQVAPSLEENRVFKANVAMIYIVESPDLKKLMHNLIDAAKDEGIQGIVLIIDSYGGSSSLFSTLHDSIKKVGQLKPIVSVIVGSALSGGYILASPTDYIIAHSMSSIGNIGVYHEIVKYKEPKTTGDVKAQMDVEVLFAGEFKALHNPYRALCEADKDYIKSMLNKQYEQFISLVANDRNLPKDTYKLWAEGKEFLSAEAVELGLIDEVGTIFEAEQKMLSLIRTRYPDSSFTDEINFISYNEPKVA